jgi:transposase
LYENNISQSEVICFLRDVLRQIRGHLIVLWDRIGTHDGEEINRFISQHPRLHVVALPAYAPELNPDELVWAYMKDQMANSRPETMEELMDMLSCLARKAASSQTRLKGYILGSDLPPFLST